MWIFTRDGLFMPAAIPEGLSTRLNRHGILDLQVRGRDAAHLARFRKRFFKNCFRDAAGRVMASSGSGARYLHEFDHTGQDPDLFEQAAGKKKKPNDHRRLAEILRGYKRARIVVSYYDCPEIRQLYDGWTFVDCAMNKQLHAQNGRGARKKVAPEVLIINGPEY